MNREQRRASQKTNLLQARTADRRKVLRDQIWRLEGQVRSPYIRAHFKKFSRVNNALKAARAELALIDVVIRPMIVAVQENQKINDAMNLAASKVVPTEG